MTPMPCGRWRPGRRWERALDGRTGWSVVPEHLPEWPLHASVNPPPLPAPLEPTDSTGGDHGDDGVAATAGWDWLAALPEALLVHALQFRQAVSADELRALAATCRGLRRLVFTEFGALIRRRRHLGPLGVNPFRCLKPSGRTLGGRGGIISRGSHDLDLCVTNRSASGSRRVL